MNKKVQELIDKKGDIYFEKDTYVISKPIQIHDNTFVECHPEATFILSDMARCHMFTSDKTLNKNVFKWIGGIIDGNFSNQGEEIEPHHDVSRAFALFNFNNIEIGNVIIKDIMGHGIAHWGNESAYFHDIEFQQSLSPTHPYGGGRKDGITGCSKNIVFENISGFTDDDFIAICAGYDWMNCGNPIDVESVIIKNLNAKTHRTDSSFGTYRGLAIYINDGYHLKNLYADNIDGIYNTEFMKIDGGDIDSINLNDINIKFIPKNISNIHGILWVANSNIKKLFINNFTSDLENGLLLPFIHYQGDVRIAEFDARNVKSNYNN